MQDEASYQPGLLGAEMSPGPSNHGGGAARQLLQRTASNGSAAALEPGGEEQQAQPRRPRRSNTWAAQVCLLVGVRLVVPLLLLLSGSVWGCEQPTAVADGTHLDLLAAAAQQIAVAVVHRPLFTIALPQGASPRNGLAATRSVLTLANKAQDLLQKQRAIEQAEQDRWVC